MLIGDYECASEVSGIQFNADLKQVATSHHSCLPEAAAAAAAATHVRGDFFEQSNLKALKTLMIYISSLLSTDSWCRKHRSALATDF